LALTVITDPLCLEYRAPGHPERPERVKNTVDLLKSQKALAIQWEKPTLAPDADILRAHTAGFLAQLPTAVDFDADTPAYPGIAEHARRSTGGALRTLEIARNGGAGFSLLRPPGHHATRERAMGFCYLSSAAITALAAQAAGSKRVAVFDFDVHHGNGTEDILLDVPGTAFISVHQFPAYPGTGRKNRGTNCFNFPVRPATPRAEYRAVLEKAFEELKKFGPDMIVVSAGFDAYRGDPLASGSLEAEDYHWLGETIRQLQIPACSILEGGYSEELPELIFAYLRGLSG